MCIYLQVYYDSDAGVIEFGFGINTTIVVVVSFHLAVETLHWVYTYVMIGISLSCDLMFLYHLYCLQLSPILSGS